MLGHHFEPQEADSRYIDEEEGDANPILLPQTSVIMVI